MCSCRRTWFFFHSLAFLTAQWRKLKAKLFPFDSTWIMMSLQTTVDDGHACEWDPYTREAHRLTSAPVDGRNYLNFCLQWPWPKPPCDVMERSSSCVAENVKNLFRLVWVWRVCKFPTFSSSGTFCTRREQSLFIVTHDPVGAARRK